MRGAIVGDVIGSIYEKRGPGLRPENLVVPGIRFTDDTVCTVAVADALLTGRPFGETIKTWCRRYPNAGYGGMFRQWLKNEIADGYGSWGNGAPMRVSPCAWLAPDLSHALELARQASAPTHNHPRAEHAAGAVVEAIIAGRTRGTKDAVRQAIKRNYDELRNLEDIAAVGRFDIEADFTVLNATACVLEADDFEGVIRNAIYIGGDVDTNAAIAGSIAETIFPIPDRLWSMVESRLADDLRGVLKRFDAAVTR